MTVKREPSRAEIATPGTARQTGVRTGSWTGPPRGKRALTPLTPNTVELIPTTGTDRAAGLYSKHGCVVPLVLISCSNPDDDGPTQVRIAPQDWPEDDVTQHQQILSSPGLIVKSEPSRPEISTSEPFFVTLVAGPRRSLSLKLSDTRVYGPQIPPEPRGKQVRIAPQDWPEDDETQHPRPHSELWSTAAPTPSHAPAGVNPEPHPPNPEP